MILTPKIPNALFWDNLGFLFLVACCFFEAAMCVTGTQTFGVRSWNLRKPFLVFLETRGYSLRYKAPLLQSAGVSDVSLGLSGSPKVIDAFQWFLKSLVYDVLVYAPWSRTSGSEYLARDGTSGGDNSNRGYSAALVGYSAPLLCSIRVSAPHRWVPAPHPFAALRFQRRIGVVNRLRFVGAANVSNQIPRAQSGPSAIPATCPEDVSELQFGSKMPSRSIQDGSRLQNAPRMFPR